MVTVLAMMTLPGSPAKAQSPSPALQETPSGQDSGQTGTLVIHVQNVSPRGGTLRLGLYDQARYDDDKADALASADVPARMGETTVTLTGIPPGVYAIETFQDVDGDGKMNTNWLGLPLEPYGFSRDARPRLSKPGFERVKFEVAAGMNVQALHLQNSMSVVARK